MTAATDPILVAGAGPTGLALALWLHKVDPSIPVKIISKASRPGTTSRAIVVHARTLELYRQLGIADQLVRESGVLHQVSVLKNGRRRATLSFSEFGAGLSCYPFVLTTNQEFHEQTLLTHLKAVGIQVEWEQELQGIEQFSDHVVATINGKQQRFSYVAGCDGAYSTVRKCCGIQMDGELYRSQFFVADVRVASDAVPSGINISPGKHIMVVFLKYAEAGHCRLIGAFPADRNIQEPTFEHIRKDVRDATGLDVKTVEWFSVYRIRNSVAEKFRDRRVFLLGDAAHQHSPVGGQGMNTGIGDAFNLGWKLASVYNKTGPDEVLDTYHSEREAFAQILIKGTDRAFKYLNDTGWIGWLVRCFFIPFIVPLIWKIRPARSRYFQVASQIAVEYSHSTLSQQKQASVKDTHEPLPIPQWHLIRFVKEVHEKPEVANFKNIPIRSHQYTEDAGAKGFVEGQVYLVRPDGYIGLIANGLDDSQLEDYADKWGVNRLQPSVRPR